MAPRRRRTWEQNLPLRLRFEDGVRDLFPDLTRRAVGSRKYARIAYCLTVPVAEYEPRKIELRFPKTTPEPTPARIYADGSEDSPHRYAPQRKDPRSSLCVWHPEDPPDRRWVPEDGLLSLVEMVRVHLFKEAYWREKAVWLGEQAPHATPESK
jgi:hypothetical protein